MNFKSFELSEVRTPTLTLNPIGMIGRTPKARVLLARCEEMQGRVCAVKVVRLQNDEGVEVSDQVVGWATEVWALKVLTKSGNPYVQKLIASKRTKGYGYIVTEYHEYGSLDKIQSQYEGNRLPPELAQFYCAEIVVGLGLMHLAGVKHRDIKPANIFINSRGHVELGDFDFAEDCDWSNDPSGTPMYMSPERLRGELYDASSDYWSMGMTAFVMNFGYHPTWDPKITSEANESKIMNENIPIRYDRNVPNTDLYKFLESILANSIYERLGGDLNRDFEYILKDPYLSRFDRTSLLQGTLPPPGMPPCRNPRDAIKPLEWATPIGPYRFKSRPWKKPSKKNSSTINY